MLNKSLHLALLSPAIRQAETIQRVQQYLPYPKYPAQILPASEDEHKKHGQMPAEYQSDQSEHEGKGWGDYGNFYSEKGIKFNRLVDFFLSTGQTRICNLRMKIRREMGISKAAMRSDHSKEFEMLRSSRYQEFKGYLQNPKGAHCNICF